MNDFIQIFNGLDTTAQLVYMGNQGGDLTDFAINSNNPSNALMMRIISNGTNSCSDGHALTAHWVVGCGLVGIDENTDSEFTMFPNPTDGLVYLNLPSNANGSLHVDVYDVTGRKVSSEQFSATGMSVHALDLHELQSGNYSVVLTAPTWMKTKQLQIAR